jgi:hypothetical protein
MANDFKWIGWDKPETIISRMALEIEVPKEYLKLWKPGTFKFNDGTTQGWAIDQLYDTNDPTMTKIPPYTDPNTGKFYGFSLSNHQNLGLAAGAYPLIVLGSQAKSLDFYLDSPDLLNDQDWKNLEGYSLDLQRNFFSYCADPPEYKVQLQARMWDKQQNKMRTFAEWDESAKQFVFHTIKSFQPYHFVWKADVFTDPNLVLRFLRIRFTQPNLTAPGAGECLPKGPWLIGNVSPEG